MTINELKNILTKLDNEGKGENTIIMKVTDSYGLYGMDAEIRNPRLDDAVWGNFRSNVDAGLTTITVDLDDNEGKKPKITFRS